MQFRSKVDAWLAITLVVSALIVLVAAYSIAARATGVWLVGPAVLVAIGAGLPLWLLLSTNYTVNGTTLSVRSGPFSWQIPISKVTRIVPTRSPLSSPALSLDRLRIEYGPGKAVLVSPRNQGAFIRAINEVKSAA